MLRHDVVQTIRRGLDAEDFLEIETPILTRSTPEGARDFLVPARLQPGSFYALPQSPQLFKQLLMIGGYERYFQIARCFRDEDLRADRQPEFTQLDLEMSFVDEDDVIDVNERLMAKVFAVGGLDVPPPPYPRMPYDEAMLRFGSDRPDTRFGLEIADVSDALRGSEFKVFANVLGGGGVVRAINAGAARGAALGARRADRGRQALRRRRPRVGVRPGRRHVALADREVPRGRGDRGGDRGAGRARRATCCWPSPTSPSTAAAALGALRLELAERWDLVPDGRHDVLWVVDFPMFELRRRRGPLGRAAPPVHRADRATSPIRARCARAPTTSSSTAGSSAAARSASTTRPSRAGSSRSSAWTRRRRSGASASCSRRCATARRRTAASRSASTASSRCSPAATRSATSSRSRRPRAARTR